MASVLMGLLEAPLASIACPAKVFRSTFKSVDVFKVNMPIGRQGLANQDMKQPSILIILGRALRSSTCGGLKGRFEFFDVFWNATDKML
eukprot:1087755-Amphidinium_carterae.2